MKKELKDMTKEELNKFIELWKKRLRESREKKERSINLSCTILLILGFLCWIATITLPMILFKLL